MVRRLFFSFGIIAAVLYAAAVILGGALRPGYDHLSMAVSELITAGAPNKTLLDAMFSVYNALLILFAWAAGMSLRGDNRKLTVSGAYLLGAVGVMGLALTLFFPMDPRGSAATTTGTLHLILAGGLSLGTILSILLFTLGNQEHGAFWVYSFVSVALVFVSGGFAAATAAMASPILGLAERITILLFLQWVAGFGAKLIRDDLGR
jgi:hypothetical protein